MILLTTYNVRYFDITTEVFMSPGCDIQSTVKKYSLFDNKVEIQKMNISQYESFQCIIHRFYYVLCFDGIIT